MRRHDEGNGARLNWPAMGHQQHLLRALEHAPVKFGVVPYSSVVAAFTDGKIRDWNQKPIARRTLQREVSIVVPSGGERWREVTEKDKYGKPHRRQVHTLGDSVVRVHDRFYLSAVDPTGVGAGLYFLAELPTDRPPKSLQEAFDALKPKIVREAEARGAVVRRQGEWFAIPTMFRTSELMRDVERGVAVPVLQSLLGHASPETTMIYTHPLEDIKRQAVDNLASLLFPNVPPRGRVIGKGSTLIQ